MTTETLVALVVFLFALAYSPGPGNTFFAAIGASQGLRAAIPALAGYHVATFAVTVTIGLGLGLTVLGDPRFAAVLGATGASYVCWLGVRTFRSARAGDVSVPSLDDPTRRIGFTDGAVVLLVNPKAYTIIGLLFTQFLRPDEDRFWQVVSITTVFTLNNLVAFLAWVLGGAVLARVFRGAGVGAWIEYVFAASLVGVGVWMAVGLLPTAR